MKFQALSVIGLGLFFCTLAYSECLEYEVVDHGDSVEAVCVGKPLTPEEQKNKLEEEKKEQLKAIAERNERKLENDRIAAEIKAQEQKALEAKRAPVKTPEKTPDKSTNRLERARQQTTR